MLSGKIMTIWYYESKLEKISLKMKNSEKNTIKYVVLNCLSTLLAIGCGCWAMLLIVLIHMFGSFAASAHANTLNFVLPLSLVVFGTTIISSWVLIFKKKYPEAMWVGFVPIIFFLLIIFGS